jgi:large subunit ribosomal protein L4
MATLTIKDAKGAEVGTLDAADAVFGIEPNLNAVRQSVLAYEANQRQGTHSTKTRSFARGGGRKPWRQKGTGRARQGSIRAPQWRGGAVVFGPTPRDYSQKVNRKTRRLALLSALSELRNANRITVVKNFELSRPKTAEFEELLGHIGAGDDAVVLILLAEPDENVVLSSRNLPFTNVLPVHNINIYDLLTCDRLVTTPEGIKKLEELFG